MMGHEKQGTQRSSFQPFIQEGFVKGLSTLVHKMFIAGVCLPFLILTASLREPALIKDNAIKLATMSVFSTEAADMRNWLLCLILQLRH